MGADASSADGLWTPLPPGPVQLSRKQYVTLWELTFYWWVDPNQGHKQSHKQETQPAEMNRLTDFILVSESIS